MDETECYLLIWQVMPVTARALWDVLAPYEIQLIHFFSYVVTQRRRVASNLLLEPGDGLASVLQHTREKENSACTDQEH